MKEKEIKYIEDKKRINGIILKSLTIFILFGLIFIIYGITVNESFFSINLYESNENYIKSKKEKEFLEYANYYYNDSDDFYILPISRENLVSLINNINIDQETFQNTEIEYKERFYNNLKYYSDEMKINGKYKVKKNEKISEKLKELNNKIDINYKTIYTLAYYPKKVKRESLVLYTVKNLSYLEEKNKDKNKYINMIRDDTKKTAKKHSKEFYNFLNNLDNNKIQKEDKLLREYYKTQQAKAYNSDSVMFFLMCCTIMLFLIIFIGTMKE